MNIHHNMLATRLTATHLHASCLLQHSGQAARTYSSLIKVPPGSGWLQWRKSWPSV